METAAATATRKFVAYLRISKEKTGTEGLSEEGQIRDVNAFVLSRAGQMVAMFREIESAKDENRPQLMEAMRFSKEIGATLVIAKLDRLSRRASFVMSLRDSGVDFVAADMPDANTLTIGIMALVAQQEREFVSSRTKAALTSLKERGVKLGTPENISVVFDTEPYIGDRTLKFRTKAGELQYKWIGSDIPWMDATEAIKEHYALHRGRMKSAQQISGAVKKEQAAMNENNRRARGYANTLRLNGLTLDQIAEKLNAEGFKTATDKPFTRALVCTLVKESTQKLKDNGKRN